MIAKSFILLSCIALASCGSHPGRYSADNLSCIQIVDRNDLSETIGTKDRIKQYESTDFTSPQPYQQVLRIFEKDEMGKTPSILTSYHPNGQIHRYLEVSDARAFGMYKEWHPNGILKIQANVIGGPADLSTTAQKEWLFDGNCSVWDDKGNSIALIPYEKGFLQGTAIHHHPNGEIARIIPYEKSQLQGEFSEFDEEGHPIQKIQFQGDLKNGDALRYWPNGALSSLETYKSGLLENGIYYNMQGEKVSEVVDGSGNQAIFTESHLSKLIQHENGKPEGLISCFDGSGRLTSSYYILEGLKNGTETLYFSGKSGSSPSPQMSIDWKNDQIHGMVKTWYPNGTLESQKVIYRNKKNGSSCCWYQNSKIMLIEEYEDDKLIKGSYYKLHDSAPSSEVFDGHGTATIYDENGVFVKKIQYEKGLPVDPDKY